jgi:formate dehydrogenase beta subunit
VRELPIAEPSLALDARRRNGHTRRGRLVPRGRALEPAARELVASLLAGRSCDRGHLIDNLHAVHDQVGHLTNDLLAAVAATMQLSRAEVFEVASFYSQFVLVDDGEAAPPAAVVRVCEGLACRLAGSDALHAAAKGALGGNALVLHAPCMGRCDHAPVASVNQHHLHEADVAALSAAVTGRDFAPDVPPHADLDAYRASGGYRLLEACLAGTHDRDAVIATLSDAKLRGLGGAGYPTGQKWRSVRRLPKPKVVAVNFDESEMGTFKDRVLIERDPHRMLEGALLAAWACEAYRAFIYLRDEYHGLRAVFEREIARLDAAGLTRECRLTLVRGAGAYVCGERSAMLESIEGKRGYPRLKDPRTTVVGLFGIPTLINNAETLFWVRDILEQGADWFAGQGRNGRSGPRAFSVSGRVVRPGLKLAQSGITMNELLAEYCGGMARGHRFKGYCVGGSAGGILPASMADIPLDFDVLEPHGCSIGSGAITVFSDHDSIRDVVRTLMRFFEDESCGQCTPCRVGTEKAVMLLEHDTWDEGLLTDLCDVMEDASICGLGTAAPHPIRTALRYFRDELGLEGGAR